MTAALRMLADAGAVFTLCYPSSKRPIGDAWQDQPHAYDEAAAHLQRGGNVGLLAGAYSAWIVALDLDRRAKQFAEQHPQLVKCFVYRKNAPDRGKFLVRCEGARGRKDHAAGLEILSTGNNAILTGRHESGALVKLVCRDDLPTLTIAELATIFEDWTGSPYDAPTRRHRPAPELPALGTSPAAIRLTLAHISPRRADDYNEWVRIGIALKSAHGDTAFAAWDEWSSQSPKYDPDITRAKWESFHPDGRLSGGTLTYL